MRNARYGFVNYWAVAVVVLLVLISVMKGGLPRVGIAAETDNQSHAAPGRFSSWLKLRWRIVGQLIALVVITVGFGVWGYVRIPDIDPEIRIPNTVVLEMPSWLGGYDTRPESRANITEVNWYELSSGTSWPATLPRPELRSIDVPVDVIRVGVQIRLSGMTDADRRVLLRLNLPPQAEVSDCSADGGRLNCHSHEVERNDDDTFRTRNVLDVEGTINRGEWSFGFFADIKGTQHGLTFGRAGNHALVRSPHLIFQGPNEGEQMPPDALPSSFLSGQPIVIRSELYFADADQFSWSGPSPEVALAQGASWKYTMSGDSFFPPPPASGVRATAIEQNSVNYFWAGILLGIAGGGVVALVQLSISEIGRKGPRLQN